VWVENLGRFIEDEQRRTVKYHGSARPFARLKAGLAFLRDERAARRKRTFEELVGLWRRQESEGVWRRMLATLEAHAPRPPAEGEPPVRILTPPGAAGT